MLEGRVTSFYPGRPNRRDEATGTPPVHLVELFSDLDEPRTQAAQLAFDGLARYLPTTMFIQYHVGDVLAADVSASRAAYYQPPPPPAAYFDGAGPVVEGGEAEETPRVFGVYQERCASSASPTQLRIDGRVERIDDAVRLAVTVHANREETAPVVHAILCEKAVMAIGGNGQVLHYHLARDALSPPEGWPMERAAPSCSFEGEADLEGVRRRLDNRLDALAARRGERLSMRPTWIDAAACEVVVFVQDSDTRQVVAAQSLPIGVPRDGEP
jgi:hypothetical protein